MWAGADSGRHPGIRIDDGDNTFCEPPFLYSHSNCAPYNHPNNDPVPYYPASHGYIFSTDSHPDAQTGSNPYQ